MTSLQPYMQPFPYFPKLIWTENSTLTSMIYNLIPEIFKNVYACSPHSLGHKIQNTNIPLPPNLKNLKAIKNR